MRGVVPFFQKPWHVPRPGMRGCYGQGSRAEHSLHGVEVKLPSRGKGCFSGHRWHVAERCLSNSWGKARCHRQAQAVSVLENRNLDVSTAGISPVRPKPQKIRKRFGKCSVSKKTRDTCESCSSWVRLGTSAVGVRSGLHLPAAPGGSWVCHLGFFPLYPTDSLVSGVIP